MSSVDQYKYKYSPGDKADGLGIYSELSAHILMCWSQKYNCNTPFMGFSSRHWQQAFIARARTTDLFPNTCSWVWGLTSHAECEMKRRLIMLRDLIIFWVCGCVGLAWVPPFRSSNDESDSVPLLSHASRLFQKLIWY